MLKGVSFQGVSVYLDNEKRNERYWRWIIREDGLVISFIKNIKKGNKRNKTLISGGLEWNAPLNGRPRKKKGCLLV